MIKIQGSTRTMPILGVVCITSFQLVGRVYYGQDALSTSYTLEACSTANSSPAAVKMPAPGYEIPKINGADIG